MIWHSSTVLTVFWLACFMPVLQSGFFSILTHFTELLPRGSGKKLTSYMQQVMESNLSSAELSRFKSALRAAAVSVAPHPTENEDDDWIQVRCVTVCVREQLLGFGSVSSAHDCVALMCENIFCWLL